MDIEAGHDRCARHGITGIYFVALGQQVLAAGPDAEPAGRTERSLHVPQHELLRGDGIGLRIEPGDVLHAGGQVPASAPEVGTRTELVFGSRHDGVLHVQVAVIGIHRPALVDAPGSLDLRTGIFDPARIEIEHAAARGVRERQDEVLAVDVEEVDAVGQPSVGQLLREGQLVVPHRLGLEIGILRREHVHFAENRVAEPFGGRGFQFDSVGEVERHARLRHPFRAHP